MPVPAVFTPQECAAAVLDGARVVKLFPTQLWHPGALKALRGVGMFKNVHICPSGGVTPATAVEWMQNGAYAVGMGSNLVGGEVSCPQERLEAMSTAWADSGRARAADLFKRMEVQVDKLSSIA